MKKGVAIIYKCDYLRQIPPERIIKEADLLRNYYNMEICVIVRVRIFTQGERKEYFVSESNTYYQTLLIKDDCWEIYSSFKNWQEKVCPTRTLTLIKNRTQYENMSN